MRTPSLILLVLLVTLTGCITWHEGFPEAHISPSTTAGTEPQFLYGVVTTKDFIGVHNAKVMRNVIKDHPVFLTEVEPGTESISKKYVRISILNSENCYLLSFSISCPQGPMVIDPILGSLVLLFPGYEENFYSIQYDFYNDGIVSAYGPYKFVQKRFTWTPLLPFIWVNLLTSYKQDAFSATLHQFILDAHRDGYL
jgi:hypothetical protein